MSRLNARGWSMAGCMSPEYRAERGYPLRQAVRYTGAEDQQLLAAWEAGASISELAADHQRREGAIAWRIERLLERRRIGEPFGPVPRQPRVGYKRGPYLTRKKRQDPANASSRH